MTCDPVCSFVTQGMTAPAQGAEGKILAEPCTRAELVAAFGLDEPDGPMPRSCSGGPMSETLTWLCGQVSSTFDVARQLALAPWSGVLAIRQRSGRGQLGRAWVSPPGNLYAALALPAVFPFTHDLAALAAGALASSALAEQGVRVKWPNDLIMLQNGVWRKIGGLLIEEREGQSCLGLGLNIKSAPSDDAMRRDRAFEAGTLPYEGSLWRLWQKLVCSMREGYKSLASQPPAAWVAMILSQMAFAGQMVEVVDEPEVPALRGRFAGLDASGGLRLQTSDGERIVQAGSLRLV